jgi:predicted NUDIX family NTP pyrophosphohydrolase
MAKQSAGILLYRFRDDQLQVFLIHPGGPFFSKKDIGNWSVPKGEFNSDENPLDAAKREFMEETGQPIDGKFIELEPVIQKAGKKVYAWAVEGDIDHENIVSNLFEMEWPPRSGEKQNFPEVDKAGWFDIGTAKIKINSAQVGFIEELIGIINSSKTSPKKDV